ncbi:ATP-binding protein [Halosimplex halobium]|uniref:ATP-binding protein n=1 Tax=Halosimplex halobium TaxID=3396618 RepID=UPI003F573D25
MSTISEIPSLFETCTPHDDVLEGTLSENKFAAKLSEVVFNPEAAPDIYSDPDSFFEKTYPTEGLQDLLTILAKRYVGQYKGEFSGEDGLLSLDTVFGGGKTHSQIAAYHFSQHPDSVEDLGKYVTDDDIRAEFEEIKDNISVRTAVFEGGYVSGKSAKCNKEDDNAPDTQTMWGELAYQLAGAEGYAQFSDYDNDLSAPGEAEIATLFESLDQPGLVLIDEVAQYFEQAAAIGVEGSTLAKQTNSFLWSLMRASQNSDAVTVVLSVSSTAFEERAEEVQDLIDDLDDISERTDHDVTPTTDDEVAAVLRNRLFKSVDDGSARKTAEAYQSFYREIEGDLPDRVTKADYRDRLERTYPFHPTLIDLLSKEIDTLPNFQRTRGALKLVSRAVYRIWNDQDTNAGRNYVRAFDMHPSDSYVWSTLLDLFEHIEQDLRAASKSDIHSDDGKAACEYEDETWTPMGHPPIATQLGTSILWKSIVSGGNRGRGVTRRKLWEMILEPGTELDHYRDALKSLNETGSNPDTEAFFLYETENGLLRFKGEPKISQLITNEASQIETGVARNRLEQTIQGALGGGVFETIYDAQAPYEIPDDYDTVRLCVMGFDAVTVTNDAEGAPDLIQTLANKTGNSPGSEKKRVYRNNVVFLVAGEQEISGALDHARRVKAMERVLNGEAWEDELNSAQRDDLDERLQQESALLGESVRQSYRHLYYPDSEELAHETLDSVNDSNDLHDIVFESLESIDKLITQDEGALGTTWFRDRIWESEPDSMTTLEIRKLVAKRTDIDILLDPKPLRATIREIVVTADEETITKSTFVFWDDTTGEGYCSETLTVTTPDGEKTLSEAEEMSTDFPMSSVVISDDHHVYGDGEKLLEGRDVTFPEPTEEEDEDEEDDEKTTKTTIVNPPGETDSGPSEISFNVGTDTPRAIQGAFSDVNSAIDQKKMRLRDNYDVSSNDIEVVIGSIEIELEGDQVWERAWFISNKLKDLDGIGQATSIVFEFVAEGTDRSSSVFEAGFEGSAAEFANHFGTNHIPESFISAGGDSEGEAVLTIDSGSMEDDSREATLDVLQEALENLGGINNVELDVSGIVKEASEQSEEVSA